MKKNLVEGNSLRINRKKGKNAVQLEGIPSASAAIQSEWTPFRSENCFQRRLCILLAGLLAEYQVLYIPDFLFHGMLLMIEMYIFIKPAHETAETPERRVEKSFPRSEINRHGEGQKWVIGQNWGRMAKIGFLDQKPKFWVAKKGVTF